MMKLLKKIEGPLAVGFTMLFGGMIFLAGYRAWEAELPGYLNVYRMRVEPFTAMGFGVFVMVLGALMPWVLRRKTAPKGESRKALRKRAKREAKGLEEARKHELSVFSRRKGW